MRPTVTFILAALLGACATSPDSAAPHPASTPAYRVEVPTIERPGGETAAWWFRDGAAQAAARGAMNGRAKNVIVFLGDGMSLTTVAAARILEGQRQGGPGEEHRLSWEAFPNTALSRTYNTDSQTPDSAGTMSAIATGAKTRIGVLNIAQSARRGDCAAALQAPLLSLWELASASGMATGVVTTARVTHATPAATFGHSIDRNWEADRLLPQPARDAGCIDIARQLVETPFADGFEVLMGGGRGYFLPDTQPDPEDPELAGRRTDGRDLAAEWQRRHPGGTYAWNRAQFEAAAIDKPLLGLFERSHMQFEHDRPDDAGGEPSLAEMTRAAIARLQRFSTDDGGAGYVLLVEAGRIDHAHHYGNAHRALTDTIAMSDAVRAAVETTSADDTLVLVTADHAHTLTFAGYPVRGNPILGKVRGSSGEEKNGGMASDALDLPYTTLGYANGPGYPGTSDEQPTGPKRFLHEPSDSEPAVGRTDLSNIDTTDPDYLQEAGIPLKSETHGGQDVGVWALGPGSDAVRGSLEQNAIFHILVQATPRLRQRLCDAGLCNGEGVPVELPDIADFAPER
jgi:alkaline phosphatase